MAKDEDTVRVTVCNDIIVSEKRWRALMQASGVDMTCVVTAAHVAKTVRALVQKQLTDLGFPQ